MNRSLRERVLDLLDGPSVTAEMTVTWVPAPRGEVFSRDASFGDHGAPDDVVAGITFAGIGLFQGGDRPAESVGEGPGFPIGGCVDVGWDAPARRRNGRENGRRSTQRDSPVCACRLPLTRAHTRRGRGTSPRIGLAALKACLNLDTEKGTFYADVVRVALGKAAQTTLEALMQSPEHRDFQSEFAKKYTALGRAEGKTEDILTILEARGLTLSAEQQARIFACSDLEVLGSWIRRAVTVKTVEELFT